MIKVLIIEDDNELRADLIEILMVEGYTVLAADNGKLGLQIAQEQHPDLILCDIQMPIMDGYHVFTELHRSPDTDHIPFIFLTAQPPGVSRQPDVLTAANDVIIKPFEVESLLRKIRVYAAS